MVDRWLKKVAVGWNLDTRAPGHLLRQPPLVNLGAVGTLSTRSECKSRHTAPSSSDLAARLTTFGGQSCCIPTLQSDTELTQGILREPGCIALRGNARIAGITYASDRHMRTKPRFLSAEDRGNFWDLSSGT